MQTIYNHVMLDKSAIGAYRLCIPNLLEYGKKFPDIVLRSGEMIGFVIGETFYYNKYRSFVITSFQHTCHHLHNNRLHYALSFNLGIIWRIADVS